MLFRFCYVRFGYVSLGCVFRLDDVMLVWVDVVGLGYVSLVDCVRIS